MQDGCYVDKSVVQHQQLEEIKVYINSEKSKLYLQQ